MAEFYKPHYNICLPPYIAGNNFYVFVYLAFLIVVPSVHLIRRFHNHKMHSKASGILTTALFTAFALFYLLSVLQTISQIDNARAEFKIFTNKSNDEKNIAIAGKKLYGFVQYCRKILPGVHNAQFLTDMDLSNDPGMITQRMLAYYLYPIDIRNVRNDPLDSLIVFAKKDAVANVPDDFRIIGVFDQSSVIAIKKVDP